MLEAKKLSLLALLSLSLSLSLSIRGKPKKRIIDPDIDKHRGLSFKQVASRDPDYVVWAINKLHERSAPGQLERFTTYALGRGSQQVEISWT